MFYTFQQSKIWEGSGPSPDPSGSKIRLKAKSEEKARNRLPSPGLGRTWVLVDTSEGEHVSF